MTVEEIFNAIGERMIQGTMYHNDLAKAFDFLGLHGFYKCHVYHSIEETKNYHELAHYYNTHYHKLLELKIENNTKIIPDAWYKYKMIEVDNGTRKIAIRDFIEGWVKWETETKQIYQSMRKELYQLGEVAFVLEIDKYIKDVSEELKHAEKKLIQLRTIDYDFSTIIDWQQPMYKKYKKLLGW